MKRPRQSTIPNRQQRHGGLPGKERGKPARSENHWKFQRNKRVFQERAIYMAISTFASEGYRMPADFPLNIKCQFIAKNWAETPFHEMNDAGKLSRASITNALSGEIDGEGTLEYLLAYPAITGNDVTFIGYERILARIGSREGSFVIKHEGAFSPLSGVNGKLVIVTGSGTGDFSSITGSGSITAKAGEHGGEYCLTLEKAIP